MDKLEYLQKVTFQRDGKTIEGVITHSRAHDQYEVFGGGRRVWMDRKDLNVKL